MGVLKPAKALGQGGGGAVTVASITDATATGKALLQAADDAAARQEIGAMGTEGDQVIDGHLQVKEKLTITAPDPGAATWVTLLDIPLQDGTPGASLDYSYGAAGSSFLRFCVRMADGTLRQLLLLSPRTGPNGQPGGIGLPGDSFLLVGNGYALDQVTDTGYAVFTADDKETARTAMAAMGTDGDQVITGQLDVDKCLSVKLQGPEDPVNYQTLFQVKQPDGTVCATISVYNQDAPGATFLRFSTLTQTGQLKKVMEIQGLDGRSVGGGSGYGGVEINSGCYLSVNNYLLDQVTATGYAVYTAKTKEDARTAIDAMGTDGDQTINGQLELKNMLTVTLPQPVADNWVPLINLAWADGTIGACTEYAHNAQDEVSLRLKVRQAKGQEKLIWQIDPTDNGHGQVGGFEIVEASYLKVGGKYYLNLVTDTGYSLLTAQDEAAARTAIGAGTSDLTATPFGEQLLQCADADAVKALLGL
ncbi:hypothetical protein D3C81_565020 [compost metagenome]